MRQSATNQSWYKVHGYDRSKKQTKKCGNAIIDVRCWAFDFSTNCAPNFIQNIDILITLANTSAEKKDLSV